SCSLISRLCSKDFEDPRFHFPSGDENRLCTTYLLSPIFISRLVGAFCVSWYSRGNRCRGTIVGISPVGAARRVFGGGGGALMNIRALATRMERGLSAIGVDWLRNTSSFSPCFSKSVTRYSNSQVFAPSARP